jgi:hypothetical protein
VRPATAVRCTLLRSAGRMLCESCHRCPVHGVRVAQAGRAKGRTTTAAAATEASSKGSRRSRTRLVHKAGCASASTQALAQHIRKVLAHVPTHAPRYPTATHRVYVHGPLRRAWRTAERPGTHGWSAPSCTCTPVNSSTASAKQGRTACPPCKALETNSEWGLVSATDR